ncbi:hypothetical protein K435DRAFT_838336 [Dendrothele bispora CBS 962.96]|uniref:Uncharacterized protein n=1 Tax=Dendrothele bispora (strain CBS 962.96) TaxID=1314807 RepID=A0A4S8M6R7_DENBC|nr:hypothetical protein K435DRAFT_838336 [Dendrothele bispora CBS 962.96]
MSLQPSSHSNLHRSSSRKLFLSVSLLLSLITFIPGAIVNAETHNVTVDDSDSSIQYSGSWVVSQNSLDNNGSLHYTEDDNAVVKFNFTGTAFYYLSPTFPFPMEAAVSITSSDGGEHQGAIIDGMYNRSAPRQPARQGGETGQSTAVYGSGDLKNLQYEVEISIGPLGGLAFDGFIYTTDDSGSSGNGTNNGTNDGGGGSGGGSGGGNNSTGSGNNSEAMSVHLNPTLFKTSLLVFVFSVMIGFL